MAEKHRIADVAEIPEGAGKEFTVAGRIVAVFRVGDEFFALDGLCAHAGGPLGKGHLQGHVVTCPWHGWQYDVRTGNQCLSAQIRQTQYPVSVSGSEIFVEI